MYNICMYAQNLHDLLLFLCYREENGYLLLKVIVTYWTKHGWK